MPWHKPRKQYVRDYQWRAEIDLMLNDKPRADNTLKYLGLPGPDLLDLRHLHAEVCEPRKLGFRFLGFNSAALPSSVSQTEMNISLDEVNRLRGVDAQSEVLGDDFIRLADENSIAWKKAVALGPYDVINLDLCDGFGAAAPASIDDTYYNAVQRLMGLQARTATSWLLLLTTRVGDDHVHAEVLDRLLLKYIKNLETCHPFRELSRELFACEDDAGTRAAATEANHLLPLFLCGLCKWLVGLALGQQPPTTAELRNVIGYRVYGGAPHEDLVSIALRFTPTFEPPVDTTGLADHPVTVPDECGLSVGVLSRVARRENADAILTGDADLQGRMVDATAELLAAARYGQRRVPRVDTSRGSFRSWLKLRVAELPVSSTKSSSMLPHVSNHAVGRAPADPVPRSAFVWPSLIGLPGQSSAGGGVGLDAVAGLFASAAWPRTAGPGRGRGGGSTDGGGESDTKRRGGRALRRRPGVNLPGGLVGD